MALFSPSSSLTQFFSFFFSTPTPWMLALALLGHVALERLSPARHAGKGQERSVRRPPFYRESRGMLLAGTALWIAMAWGSLSPVVWAAGELEAMAASIGLLLFTLFMVVLWMGAALSWLKNRPRR